MRLVSEEGTHPVNSGILRLPAAHVEGDDSDAHALCRLAVHVAQFQPRMVLLLPRPKCLLGYEWRILKRIYRIMTFWTFGGREYASLQEQDISYCVTIMQSDISN